MVNDLMLLAHVPELHPTVKAHCAKREQRFPYFRDGYVSMDLGRHTNYTDQIMEATVGYALADARGQVIQPYRELVNAENARAKAVVRVVPEVEIEDEVPAPARAVTRA